MEYKYLLTGNTQMKSRVDFVADEIINIIIKEDLKAGDKLPNEFELAKTLDVGRSTIREAMKSLETQNILDIKQGAGTFVSSKLGLMDDPLGLRFVKDKNKMVKDILEIRFMIEPSIAEMAAVNAEYKDIEEMRFISKKIEEDILLNRSHIENDIAFHTCIAKSSKNVVIPNLIPIINSAITVFIDITENKLEEETIVAHREIVDAISKHNPIAAKDSMIMHLMHNRRYIEKNISDKIHNTI